MNFKYFKPLSVTWWAGAGLTGLGVWMIIQTPEASTNGLTVMGMGLGYIGLRGANG